MWNRIDDAKRGQIIDLALAKPELSPRELAVRFTDQQRYFVSEALVYPLLKADDLIASPACIVVELEAVHHHGRQRCHRDAGLGAGRLRLHPGTCAPPAAPALRQRALLHRWRVGAVESLRNLTPADVYLGRGQTTLLDRERIKRQTIRQRRLIHQQLAA